MVKETWVQSLGEKDPLEKEMETHYSCLGNPKDRGAWWAAVHGVTKEPDLTTQQQQIIESPYSATSLVLHS